MSMEVQFVQGNKKAKKFYEVNIQLLNHNASIIGYQRFPTKLKS